MSRFKLSNISLLAALVLLAGQAFGQGSSTTAYRFRYGASLPASCIARDVFFNTSNGTFYGCSAMDTWTAFATAAAASPGGVDTNIQYNNAGAFGGASDFLYETGPGRVRAPNGNAANPGVYWQNADLTKMGFYKFSDAVVGFPDYQLRFNSTGGGGFPFLEVDANNVDIGQSLHAQYDITFYNADGTGSGDVVAIYSDTNALFGPFTGGGPYVGIVRDPADALGDEILSIANNSIQPRDLRVRRQVYANGTEPACNSTNRGYLVVVQGGAGVADTVRICTKDAADAYAYRSLF